MTEAAIDTRPTRDLFVSLGEALPGGAWILRLQYKPFIGWIWIGCLLMMSGGALAASDRRYRARGTQTVALSPQPVTAGVGR
jgi:cytochrome c-type biogenesis protein CcmF